VKQQEDEIVFIEARKRAVLQLVKSSPTSPEGSAPTSPEADRSPAP
jgi:hypothetical protein